MPEDQDIHNIAENWLQRYGGDALEQLNQRLAELEEFEQPEAHALWIKILKEVQNLLDAKISVHKITGD